jgi:hypothetical protein
VRSNRVAGEQFLTSRAARTMAEKLSGLSPQPAKTPLRSLWMVLQATLLEKEL